MVADFMGVIEALHETGRNPVNDLIGAAPFTQWDHYPPADFFDPATGALFFYHAHSPEERVTGEHGHFHCFVERSRIDASAVPLFKPKPQARAKELCHLVAVSIDMRGLPTELFTTNQWVTDEWLYPAEAVVPLIDAFSFPSTRDTSLASRWLEALIALFRPQISQLLQERDVALAPAHRRARSRKIEIASRSTIDIDERIAQLALGEIAGG